MSLKRKEAEGQFDLFGGFGGDGEADDPFGGALDIAIPTADWSKSERLVFERDMLGLYVSDHPLHGVEHVLTSHADTPIAEINAGGVEDGANVTIAGILTAVGPRTNKQGAPWAIATLEDLESGIEVLFFPKTWAEYSDKVVRDQIVVVKGRISRRDDQPSLFASEVTVPELTEGPRGPVLVSMPAARCTPPVVERLREVLGSHPGTTEVQLKLVNGSRETVLRLDQGLRVRPEHRADGRHQGAARSDQRGAPLTGQAGDQQARPVAPDHASGDEPGFTGPVSSTGPSAEPPPSDGVVPVPDGPARTRRFRPARSRAGARAPRGLLARAGRRSGPTCAARSASSSAWP